MTNPALRIALWAPRIPQNTGQIARACHAMNVPLHLIRPLGFRLDSAALRRSSVGYLEDFAPIVHADGDAFWASMPDPDRVWLVTKHGHREHTEPLYRPGDTLLLGNEDEGLPPSWLADRAAQTVRIAMANPNVRCLNLATAAAVTMFEALRQLGAA